MDPRDQEIEQLRASQAAALQMIGLIALRVSRTYEGAGIAAHLNEAADRLSDPALVAEWQRWKALLAKQVM